MSLARMSPSTDGQQQQILAVQDHLSSCAITAAQTHAPSEIDPALYSNPAPAAKDPQPQLPVLPTYSQPENTPTVYYNPALVVCQDRDSASHCPIQALYQSVTYPGISVTHQQQINSSLDLAHVSFPVLSQQVSGHQRMPKGPCAIEHDLIYPAPTAAGVPRDASLAQYLNHALPLGATFSTPQAQVCSHTETKPTHCNSLTTPLSAPTYDSSSSQSAVHRATTATPVPYYSHHVDAYMNNMMATSSLRATTTTLQPSMQLQSYPEITPSPHPPRPPIAMQHVADCHLSRYQADNVICLSQPHKNVCND